MLLCSQEGRGFVGARHMRLLRPFETAAKQLPWIVSVQAARFLNRPCAQFYERLRSGGYFPDLLINVVPSHQVVYVSIPKAASTRIRATLAALNARHMRSRDPNRRRKHRGPYGPRSMTVGSFFELATSPKTLRFSFVRNPYARAVSCWADKFCDKPLVPGDRFVDFYLANRGEVDVRLPAGRDQTLSFQQFVQFAAAMAHCRREIHVQTQDDILSMPGIRLDFIGKVEFFRTDFVRVLDHIGADDALRRDAVVPLNESHSDDWPHYYMPELADRIYRTYECDFDRFGYPRSIPDEKIRATC